MARKSKAEKEEELRVNRNKMDKKELEQEDKIKYLLERFNILYHNSVGSEDSRAKYAAQMVIRAALKEGRNG